MEKVKIFYLKYKHAVPLIIYAIIYMTWFAWLEKNTTGHYRIIHMAADDYIPFCEVFVIPYFLWFAYVSAVVIYFFFKNKEDYYRTCIFLYRHDDLPDSIHSVAQRTAPSSRGDAQRQYLHPHGSRSVPDRHTYQPVAQHSCI